ncbi:Uncharacterised protein [Burkholderia pseudomallei]|nr:Uncharacterised protein [Burkholderia pseudomallei]CAJ3904628.1 Uncharacterised protein [Burkholderia pseudomallei]CAJ3908075.1 Uncharacterised protein [Burkholderia pseudomallei]CAJ3920788.1 Uncharacterised protein [Burkholderia pseudomallei]CAJ3931785.1 Uncharacterised protein [Burkholderia pseudomallei]
MADEQQRVRAVREREQCRPQQRGRFQIERRGHPPAHLRVERRRVERLYRQRQPPRRHHAQRAGERIHRRPQAVVAGGGPLDGVAQPGRVERPVQCQQQRQRIGDGTRRVHFRERRELALRANHRQRVGVGVGVGVGVRGGVVACRRIGGWAALAFPFDFPFDFPFVVAFAFIEHAAVAQRGDGVGNRRHQPVAVRIGVRGRQEAGAALPDVDAAQQQVVEEQIEIAAEHEAEHGAEARDADRRAG